MSPSMIVSTSYDRHIESIRDVELPDLNSQVYLDASGQPAVPRSVLQAVHERLLNGPMVSNPHSNSPSGRRTREELDQVRSYVCRELFNVTRVGGRIEEMDSAGSPRRICDPGWELVFSSGTTASLQLVARCFDFECQGRFAYLEQSHSSLLGLRDIVTQERGNRGCAGVDVLAEEEMEGWIRKQSVGEGVSLLAFPLQCNATGRRYNKLVSRLLHVRDELENSSSSRRKVYILLDAASYLSPSSNLPLRESAAASPDFICFSFLKIVGYPSGLGGLLLARNSVSVLLSGKYYHGGGTLDAVTSRQHWSKPSREICKALEDGTPDLFGIISVKVAMAALRSETLLCSWASASEYVDRLTESMWKLLSSLQHGDGSPLLEIYSGQPQRWEREASRKENDFHLPPLSQGPIILFNVLRASSSASAGGPCRIDPTEVDRLACVEDIHMRSGRMCNVGSVTKALGIKEEDIQALWERGIGCDLNADVRTDDGSSDSGCEIAEADRLGSMVSGCLRISLSAWNTFEDGRRVASFLQKHFVEDCDPANGIKSVPLIQDGVSLSEVGTDTSSSEYFLEEVHLYPIKSCASQLVKGEWQLTSAGLQYDRQFCIVDLGNRKVLSQKQVPKMACIRPRVWLETGTLTVQLVDEVDDVQAEFSVPLYWGDKLSDEYPSSSYDLCGRPMQPVLWSDAHIRQLLSDFLGRDCTLAQSAESQHWPQEQDCVPLLYSNESPFLLIARESVQQVCRWVNLDESVNLDEAKVAMAFRANFVVSSRGSSRPFYEEAARRVQIGPHTFSVLGPCRRCQMIGLDQTNGSSLPEILRVVAKHCRCSSGKLKGRLLFGMHLSWRQNCLPDVADRGVMLHAGMPIQLHD